MVQVLVSPYYNAYKGKQEGNGPIDQRALGQWIVTYGLQTASEVANGLWIEINDLHSLCFCILMCIIMCILPLAMASKATVASKLPRRPLMTSITWVPMSLWPLNVILCKMLGLIFTKVPCSPLLLLLKLCPCEPLISGARNAAHWYKCSNNGSAHILV